MTPLRESLLRLGATERSAALREHLRGRVAEVLGTGVDSLRSDRPFFLLDPGWRDPMRVYFTLRSIVQEDLGLLLYPVELRSRHSLALLAEYLAEELVPPQPQPGPPVEDPYAGGSWAWRLPAPETEGKRNPAAVFILSAPRSGSTLFRTMLAGHPGLFAPPELNLLPFGSMGDRARQIDSLGYSWMRGGPITALGELEHLSLEASAGRLDEMERRDVPVRDVYRLLQEGAGDRLLVDKSPIYAMHPEWLRRSEQLFDRPKYLHLHRHPYSVIESFVRMRFHRLLGDHWLVRDEDPWRLAEKVWATGHRHILQFLAGVDPERRLAVRYEDLVAEPAQTAAAVCAFLGVPYHEAVVRPYEGERMTRQPAAGASGKVPTIGDPNLLARDRIDPGLGETWKRARPPQGLGEFARQVAAELGCELDAG